MVQRPRPDLRGGCAAMRIPTATAVVAGVDVRLEDPGEGPQMLDRVIAGPVPRVAEQCRRRVRTAERRVVADVDPGPRGSGLALGQHRHRRVIAVQTLRRQHMRRDPVVQRPQRHRAGAHLVGQGRQAEIDTFARVAIPLAVELSGWCWPYFSKTIIASRFGPAQPRGVAWNGAGGWEIFSQ